MDKTIIMFKHGKSYEQLKKEQKEQKDKLIFKLYNRPYTFFKSDYKPIMPLKIYQTWHTKQLPPKMKECVECLKIQNPTFEHFLFDDEDCRKFIETNFSNDILNAYDSLIPGAYKSDLWRLCVLYKNGGIYIDIKLSCINNFKLIELTENNHFVKDRVRPLSIYNAVMACEKNHPFLLDAINKIVSNVKNKYYGSGCLWPTGPEMLGDLILKKQILLNIDLFHYIKGGYVIYKNKFVFSTSYPEYESERKSSYDLIKTKYYSELWNERKVYK